MDFIDWFAIGCLIGVVLVFIAGGIRICCCSETSSVGPGKKQRVMACARLKFDTCTGKEEGDGGCAICLGEYKAGEWRATISECKHRFHAECVMEWIKLKCTCPLCRHYLV
ncbi:RING-H2 finger protein ATL80-like [Salvia hispanica]|uniref:RING-H2 finger protein ATL80-like n=1 Tax=Salvia hispanica TaxID=49212 RepID=UPI00200989C3|nr:RING-H2 finger protein ATL80-like [Salvia hispanica]